MSGLTMQFDDVDPDSVANAVRNLLADGRTELAFRFTGARTGAERIVSSKSAIPKGILASGKYEEFKRERKKAEPKPKAEKPPKPPKPPKEPKPKKVSVAKQAREVRAQVDAAVREALAGKITPEDLAAMVRGAVEAKLREQGKDVPTKEEAKKEVEKPKEKATPEVLTNEIGNAFEELLREKYSVSGLVPIHELRDAIRKKLGDEAGRHDQVDDVIKGLWQGGKGRYRLVPITDLSKATTQQLQDSIPGMGETLYFLALKDDAEKDKVLRREVAPAAKAEEKPPTKEEPKAPLTADDIMAAAESVPMSERFHGGDPDLYGSKVFVSDLLKAAPGLTKEKLMEMQARGEIEMSRADLVQAMDPKKVADSETKRLNATFHFVRIPSKREQEEKKRKQESASAKAEPKAAQPPAAKGPPAPAIEPVAAAKPTPAAKPKADHSEAVANAHKQYEAIKADLPNLTIEEMRSRAVEFGKMPKPVLAGVLKELGYPADGTREQLAAKLLDNLTSLKISHEQTKQIGGQAAPAAAKPKAAAKASALAEPASTLPPAINKPLPDNTVGVVRDLVQQFNDQRRADVPLWELAKQVQAKIPDATPGKVQDVLRWMHDNDYIRLTGWSGSLREIPDPQHAMMVSSKIMGYAHVPERSRGKEPPVLDKSLNAPLPAQAQSAVQSALQASDGKISLPELHQQLSRQFGDVPPGKFHDLVRHMKDEGQLTFAPFEGSETQMPDPEKSLIDGGRWHHYVVAVPPRK